MILGPVSVCVCVCVCVSVTMKGEQNANETLQFYVRCLDDIFPSFLKIYRLWLHGSTGACHGPASHGLKGISCRYGVI